MGQDGAYGQRAGTEARPYDMTDRAWAGAHHDAPVWLKTKNPVSACLADTGEINVF